MIQRLWNWVKSIRAIGPAAPASSTRRGSWFLDAFLGRAGLAGVSIDHHNAETIATFFQAVSLISGDVAKLPVHTYSNGPEGRKRAREIPTYNLLRYKPCEDMTDVVWKRKSTRDVLIYGNAYSYIRRNPDLSPFALLPMDPLNTRPNRDATTQKLFYEWREKPGAQWSPLPARDMLHWRGLSEDGILGMSIIDKARESLGLTKAAENFGAAFFGNGSVSSGILEYPEKVDDETIGKIKRQWQQKTSRENAHNLTVLDAGIKFTPLTIPPEQAQFLETRRFQRQEVASWFGLPPHKLNDSEDSSYSSLEIQNQAYLDSCLDPWLVSLEAELRDKLLSEKQKAAGYEVEFMRAALLRPDTKTRYEIYQIATLNGLKSRNECRDIENDPPVPGGDEFRVPLNTVNPLLPVPPSPPPPAKKQKRRKLARRSKPDDQPKPIEQPKPVDPPAPARATETEKAPFRRLVETVIAAKIRWEIDKIAELAKKPDTFAAKLDEFYAAHRGRMIESLQPTLRCAHETIYRREEPCGNVPDAIDGYIVKSKQLLEQSRGSVVDAMAGWESRAADVAAEIIL